MRAAIALVLLFGLSARAAAQEPEHRERSARRSEETPPEDDGYRLHWTFPEVHPVEYVVGASSQIALPIVRALTDQPSTVRWRSGNFLDDGVADLVGDNTPATRAVAEVLSDVTWYSSMAWPFVDTLLVALVLDGNLHVAWQMFAVAMSVTALDGFVTLLLIHVVGRHRPRTRYCLERGGTDGECHAENAKSFPSGHTAGSFTGAGLTCAMHGALPLYGGGEHDVAACIAALTLATGTGFFRIMADKHYLTDVLAGAAIGLTFGWFLPWLLHYRFDDAQDAHELGLLLLPYGDETGAVGLSVVGEM